jgi:uncharacterized membrane protein YraQ (UPF0718 family)
MEPVETFVRGLEFAGEMAWQPWWALVLGFTIAGAVETFVSEERMSRVLGGDGFRELGLGTAPHGHTLYLNTAFTLVFASQLWVTFGPGESAGGDSVAHEHAH